MFNVVTFNADTDGFKSGDKVFARKVENTYSSTNYETNITHSWVDTKYDIDGMLYGAEFFSNVEELSNANLADTILDDTMFTEINNMYPDEVDEVEKLIMECNDVMDLISEKSPLTGISKLIAVYLIVPNSTRGWAAKRVINKRYNRLWEKHTTK